MQFLVGVELVGEVQSYEGVVEFFEIVDVVQVDVIFDVVEEICMENVLFVIFFDCLQVGVDDE